MKLCKRCVNPDTGPTIFFDAEGICPVCRYEEEKRKGAIDWDERRRELDGILQWGRENSKCSYDCIVTVSGGKDSTTQALFARDELGAKPLLVSCVYPPEQLHERGAHNLSNLISLGFDTISISLNSKVWKLLMLRGFLKYGNWARSTEMALYAVRIHAAIAYKIPLICYGENPAWTIGEKHGRLGGDASKLKLGNTISGGPTSLLTTDITAKDTHFYFYPPDEYMEYANLRLVYLGFYIQDWSGYNNGQFSKKHGLEVRSDPPERIGDLWGFSALDEDFRIVNQLLKYLKFGFGHGTDQVVEAINSGMMTREEGLELVRKYDGKCDHHYIERFCHYFGISEATFLEVVESLRNHEIWKRNAADEWMLSVERSDPINLELPCGEKSTPGKGLILGRRLDEAQDHLLAGQGDPQGDDHRVLGEGLPIQEQGDDVVPVQAPFLEGLEVLRTRAKTEVGWSAWPAQWCASSCQAKAIHAMRSRAPTW